MEENKRKRRQIFAPRMQKKLVVLFVIVLLAFAGLGARLVFIVTENKNEYQKLMKYMSVTDPDAFMTVYTVKEIQYKPKVY